MDNGVAHSSSAVHEPSVSPSQEIVRQALPSLESVKERLQSRPRMKITSQNLAYLSTAAGDHDLHSFAPPAVRCSGEVLLQPGVLGVDQIMG